MATAISDFERAVEVFKENSALNEAELVDFQLTDLQSLQTGDQCNSESAGEKQKVNVYEKAKKPFLDTMEDTARSSKLSLNTSNYIGFCLGKNSCATHPANAC